MIQTRKTDQFSLVVADYEGTIPADPSRLNDQVLSSRVGDLAAKLGLKLVDRVASVDTQFFIKFEKGSLSLHRVGDKPREKFSVNFENTRRLTSHDALIRAMGPDVVHVIDATGGWCVDAASLAQYGYRVSAMEQNSIVVTMVQLAVVGMGWCDRFSLRCCDSIRVLTDLTTRACVVYLDPMYPVTSKTAKSKKALQWLQQLVGPPRGESELLFAALGAASKRVVVKRPHHAPPLTLNEKTKSMAKEKGSTGGNLVGCVRTKLVRFDIYRPLIRLA